MLCPFIAARLLPIHPQYDMLAVAEHEPLVALPALGYRLMVGRLTLDQLV